MMNTFLRKIAFKFYYLGRVEYRKNIMGIKRKHYNTIAQLDPGAVIEHEGKISNLSKNKEAITVGKLTHVRGELLVFEHGGNISIGDHCFIGEGSRIWSAKKISIGNRVLISHHVNIHDNISHPLDAEGRHKDFLHIFQQVPAPAPDLRAEEISIGDDAWIGFNVSILKGVTIGKGAIIGACSVITRDVPDFAVVVSKTEQEIVKYVHQ